MLSFARRALNFEPGRDLFLSIADNHPHNVSKLSFPAGDLSTGLRLVLDQPTSTSTSDSTLKRNNSATVVLQRSLDRPISPPQKDETPCFLSSCQLCKKPLKSDEDIYMYMGDGYCTVECRSRQIAIDERKEIEEALNRRLLATASDDSDLSQCPNGGDCQTCRLLKDLRRRRRSSGRRYQK